MSRAGWVRVVCTDKGTHPSRELALLLDRGTAYDPEWQTALFADPALTADEAAWLVEHEQIDATGERTAARGGVVRCGSVEDAASEDHDKWRMKCPTCRRDVQLRDENMRRLVAGALASTDRPRVVVDLSLLPATLG